MAEAEVRLVETPVGTARATTHAAVNPCATLVLGHGAGGGVATPDLLALARHLPAAGLTVVLVEQPWRLAGRRVAAPPATLDRAWLAVLAALPPGGPLLVGGRSAGARVACRTAVEVAAVGVLALAFPLLPPADRPSRLPELDLPAAAGLPVLVVQGDRDPFGGPGDVPPAPGRDVLAVAGADHSFRLLRGGDRAGLLAPVAERVRSWAVGTCLARPCRPQPPPGRESTSYGGG